MFLIFVTVEQDPKESRLISGASALARQRSSIARKFRNLSSQEILVVM